MEEDYEKQLDMVNQMLKTDPNNEELQDMAKQLREAIQLAEELEVGREQEAESEESEALFALGTQVQAVWSEDGEWYNCTIRSLTPNGYVVVYDGWNTKEEVDFANVRQLNPEQKLAEVEREAEATRQGIKRKIAQAADVETIPKDLPQKLKIKPNDPEEVRQMKKKKIHAFKSKVRFEQMELEQNKKQNTWQQFQTNKGKAKKVGFFTGRKKESIFKSSDDPQGKVGVTGSGKGLTEFHKREKHSHLKTVGDGDD